MLSHTLTSFAIAYKLDEECVTWLALLCLDSSVTASISYLLTVVARDVIDVFFLEIRDEVLNNWFST